MSCAFAHITMVNLLCNTAKLKSIGIDDKIIYSLLPNLKFCELGAITPDISYLAKTNVWSDNMHFLKTGLFVKVAIEKIKQIEVEEDKNKCIAWIMGYVSHMTTDMVIHPVIENKVGLYENHPTEHVVCEMHQDAHIFKRLGIGEIGTSEYIDTGIKMCHDKNDKNKLDPAIKKLFNEVLKTVYKNDAITHEINIDLWFDCFVNFVDVAEEGNIRVPNLLGHYISDLGTEITFDKLKKKGLLYPQSRDVNKDFIEDLPTPEGKMKYDDIFDKAMNKVLEMWKLISDAIIEKKDKFETVISDWNLGTGVNINSNEYVFWAGKYILPKSANKIIKNNNLTSKFFEKIKAIAISIVAIIIGFFTLLPSSQPNYYELAGNLKNLTRCVETTILAQNINPDLPDDELLVKATVHDPELLEKFKPYSKKIKHDNKNVIILIGTKDKSMSILEDASWTPEIDVKHFEKSVSIPFEFTLKLP